MAESQVVSALVDKKAELAGQIVPDRAATRTIPRGPDPRQHHDPPVRAGSGAKGDPAEGDPPAGRLVEDRASVVS
jgi:hypothetical protein